MTDMRPDLMIWSREAKIIIIEELSVPWEDNIDERNEFKGAMYQGLVFGLTLHVGNATKAYINFTIWI